MADRDAKRKRPITCLETGVTFESAYRAAKELGFADSRNIFRSIQRGTCTQGLHFYYADAPKPSPGFFLPPNRPPRPVVCLDTGETFESAFQAGRAFGIAAGAVRTSASTGVERNGLHFYYGDEPKPGPEFFRERHSKTRPIVCLETGETFDGNPAAARPLHVSPATISQAVRYGTPVAGLHFYHGDEPKPAPEFFKPIKPERGMSPMQMAAAARGRRGEPGSPGRWPAAPTRGIIDAVGKAPSVSEGAFLRLLGTVSVFMRRARRFPAGPAFPWVSLMADAFLGSRETLGGSG